MSISALSVKELREKTGVGMMDCKKALEHTQGNFDDAIQYLREKGLATAAKKSDREATEGKVFAAVQGNNGVLIQLGCETDFVANNTAFTSFGQEVAAHALKHQVSTVSSLTEQSINGRGFSAAVSELVLMLGENIGVKQLTLLTASQIGHYVHSNGKIGVLVGFSGPVSDELARDVAMHVAASQPQVVTRDEVATDALTQEIEIIKTQARNDGKPEAVLDKLVTGKLEKFYKDHCLLEQPFVKDPSQNVLSLLPKGVTITSFTRYAFS
ncbi:elongation factor Ts [bacterium]|nr:elongation factor Ts [bacterium]